MLDAAAGGTATNLLPFHVTSLLLHVLATVLLFLLLRRLTGSAAASALAALVYGVHPVMVEAIASAGERKTVLATALAFASSWAYVRGAQAGSRAARGGAVALFALALLAKPSVLMLPVAFVALDVWPLRRAASRTLLEKWPYAVLALASAGIAAVSVRATWEFGEPPPFDLPAMALKCTWLVAFYLKQLVWPAALSTVYAPPAPFTLANPVVLAGVLTTLALAAAAWFTRHIAPALATGFAVFVLLLSPTFSIVRFSPVIAYDRYVHFPALGLALALAFALAATLRPRPGARSFTRTAVVAVALAAALAEAFATRGALAPWRDSVAIWQRAVEVSPTAAPAHNGLGATWSERGDTARAIAAFERAVQADPAYGDGQQNLGRELTRAGRAAEALPHVMIAARLAPGSSSAALQLANALRAVGREDDARTQLERALQLDPGNGAALLSLGLARLQAGDRTAAESLLRRAVQAGEDASAPVALAAMLAQQQGPSAEVVRLLSGVLARERDHVPALNELAWLRATAADAAWRDTTQALALSERAVALTGGADAAVLDTRAAAAASAGRFAEAAATAERALTLARAARDSALTHDVAERLALYRKGLAYRASAPPLH
jgi:tetratricopeptide (TPR) repeat protein